MFGRGGSWAGRHNPARRRSRGLNPGGRGPSRRGAPRRSSSPAPRAGGVIGPLTGLPLMESTMLGALVVDLAINWTGWAFASALKTEKFYDLLGSVSFVTLAVGSLCNADTYLPRQVAATCMVGCWALRLGSYLVRRIARDGKDKRFDGVREDPKRFFVFWTLQAVWAFVVSLPVLLINGTGSQAALGAADAVAITVWALGFGIEAVADFQKDQWRKRPENAGRFIDEGLWSVSRHPNYMGEIMCWLGMWGLSLSAVSSVGLGAAAAASPAITALLLLKVSGVPLLEKAADKKWGSEPAYQAYKRKTREVLLLPKF
mmetsp:Transcript_14605/g.50201  ORF Transcript_14605/g.50201 Transcript_14605/m.50201 type:complete len:316 (+) Transcript_14605:38-985(+)